MTDKQQPPSAEDIRKDFEAFVKRRYGRGARPAARPAAATFTLRPKDVKAFLDRFVIRQEEAKRALAIAVCDHYNHVARAGGRTDSPYMKQNVLLLGPTGVGKTHLIRHLARLVGVPFVKADATRFSETGYVGANVEDLVRDLVAQAGGDVEIAQQGIVYLDEADKLATPPAVGGRDVSGRGVQFGLLKLLEETEIDLTAGGDLRAQMQAFIELQQRGRTERKVVNTRNILFIVSGAFTGLEEIVRHRLRSNTIGFAAKGERAPDTDAWLRHATTEDFIEFGFEPEFIGRLPVRVACHSLSATDLFHVLRDAEGSIVKQYVEAFEAYGIHAGFTDGALLKIAELAAAEKTGARALMTVNERLFRDYKFELPSSGVREFLVDDELVDQPAAVLKRLLADPVCGQPELALAGIRRFEDGFFRLHGMRVKLDEGARGRVLEIAQARKAATQTVCEELLAGYEHGLKLVLQTSGQSDFVLTKATIEDPQAELERMILESYQQGDGKFPH